MNPCYFGPPESPLFGMYTPPRASVARQASVLLCAPVGLEYMRTHYALRLLAQQLADAGLHVLRFDYHGTGDSAGEVGIGQFGIWAEDVCIALRELADISGVETATIVGLRMGAALAVEALAGGTEKAQALVLWDPVVSGRAFLEGQERMHAEMSEVRATPPRQTDELLGERFPADLRAAIRGFPMSERLDRVTARSAGLVVSSESPAYSELLTALRARWPQVQYRVVDDATDWDSLKAAFDARMTGPVVRAVAETAESIS